MQFSDRMIDGNVAPNVSQITKCGAPILSKGENHFATFMRLSTLGPKRYKPKIHALLAVFYRRVDFACVAYRHGRSRLLKYTKGLPGNNSQTRFVRLAICYFETCAVHAVAASKCGEAIATLLNQPVSSDSRLDRLRKISNRIRHFDEDVLEKGTNKMPYSIAPVWLSDLGIECSIAKLKFTELHELLVELTSECGEFNKILMLPP